MIFFYQYSKLHTIEICSRNGLQKWHQEFSNKLEVIASSYKIKLQGCNIQHKNIINSIIRVLYATVARLGDYFLTCINVEPLCSPPKTNIVCQVYSTIFKRKKNNKSYNRMIWRDHTPLPTVFCFVFSHTIFSFLLFKHFSHHS